MGRNAEHELIQQVYKEHSCYTDERKETGAQVTSHMVEIIQIYRVSG